MVTHAVSGSKENGAQFPCQKNRTQDSYGLSPKKSFFILVAAASPYCYSKVAKIGRFIRCTIWRNTASKIEDIAWCNALLLITLLHQNLFILSPLKLLFHIIRCLLVLLF